MPRIRKAYAIEVEGHAGRDIVFAPSASKAKGRVLCDMLDVGYKAGEAFMLMRVLRSPANDEVLPDEHRLVAELSPEERHIIAHAYGSDVRMGKEGYRDHYCTDPSDRRLLRLAWELGLFDGPYDDRGYADTAPWCGAFFYLTQLGRDVARSMLPTYGRA